MVTTFRGSAISLIYDRVFHYPSIPDDLPAVTLISADVEQMSNALLYASEIWAILAEVGIGIGLLWRQIGPVSIAPVLLTAVAAGINTLLARMQGKSRRIWLQAMQRRIGLTSAVLSSMKSVKLAGMSDAIAELLQEERVNEIAKASSFRWLTVWQNTVCM
jgi:ATP-binding cassette, subfamily C (CFTR/MRP), member 1